MKYCSECSEPVEFRMPADDNRERFICSSCGVVHYQNPNNVCGAILTRGDKVLMCRRAIEPRYGLWTLPAGFMENGETVEQAARREAMEEANAEAAYMHLFGVFTMPYISQVYMMFCGELTDAPVSPGVESLEVALFTREQIPWNELAFPVVGESLELFFKHGKSRVHHAYFSRDQNRNHTIHFAN